MGVSPALPITPPWDHMAWRHMAWQQCERRRSNILTEKLKAERFTATGKKKKTLRTGYKQEKKLWKPRMVRRFWAIKSQDQIHQSIIVLAGTRWKEMTPYIRYIVLAQRAEGNFSLSMDTVEQNFVHLFHLVNWRTRLSIFRLVLCGKVTITA